MTRWGARFAVLACLAWGAPAWAQQATTLGLASANAASVPSKPTKPSLVGQVSGVIVIQSEVASEGSSAIIRWEYQVKKGEGNYSGWHKIVASHKKLFLALKGFENGATYRFKVRAVNSTGNSPPSDESEPVTIPSTTPFKPTKLDVSGSNASVTLTWTAGSDGGGTLTKWQYSQKSGEGNYGPWTDICKTQQDESCPDKTSHTVADLTNGIAYKFKVRAVNGIGDGAASDESASVTPSTTPAKPTNLAVSSRIQAVELSWTAGDDGGSAVTLWKYQQKEGSNDWGAWTAIPNSGASTTSYIVTDLTSVTTYRFKVRAFNANGDGAPSNESATVSPVTVAVTLTADSIETTSAMLSIGNHTGDWHYKYTSPTGGQCSSAVSATSTTVGSLEANTSYTFKAYSDSGCSTVVVTTMLLTKPGKPAKPTTTAGSGKLTLASLVTGDGTLSKWQYKKKEGSGNYDPDWTDISETSTTLSHVVSGLTGGTSYQFKVRAVNATGNGAESDASDAATPLVTALLETRPGDGSGTPSASLDLTPSFGAATIEPQSYTQHSPIEPLTLPEASGSDGALTYTLTPALPSGLMFDAATRTLSGVPTRVQGPQSYEYTATDADVREPDVARLEFTIEVVPAAEKAILDDGLAAQGRALLSSATGVIGERFRNPGASSWDGTEACSDEVPEPNEARGKPGEVSQLADCTTGLLNTVAQAVLAMSGGSPAGGDSLALADADATWPRGPRAVDVGIQPEGDWESLLWGRSFALPLKSPGAPGSAWTLWGAGDVQGFQGDPRQDKYDGQVRSLYLGVDMQWQEQWLAGAALAQSWGETDYEAGGSAGQLEATLTSVYPYVRGTLGAGLEVWVIGGYGRGEAEITRPGPAGAATSDLSLAMGATGARQPMTQLGGVELAVVGGAGYLSLATEGWDSLVADLNVAVNQARLAVEATWAAGGLAPYVQVGGRYDGGAGQRGAGLETVVGLRYTSERLEFEARGRWLATHAAEGYEEYGGLARLAMKPRADGTGWQMDVAPRWGAAQGAGLLGGGAVLLDGGAMPGAGAVGVQSGMNRVLALESELGYGFGVLDGQGVLTPYGGFALTGEKTRQYRLGGRLGVAEWLNLSLEGSRREAMGQQPADQGVQLRFEGRF